MQELSGRMGVGDFDNKFSFLPSFLFLGYEQTFEEGADAAFFEGVGVRSAIWLRIGLWQSCKHDFYSIKAIEGNSSS